MSVLQGMKIAIKETAVFLIRQAFPIGRIAEENAVGCLQLQLLERNAGEQDIILTEPCLANMASGKLQRIRIDIRSGDTGDVSVNQLASDFFPDCIQYPVDVCGSPV